MHKFITCNLHLENNHPLFHSITLLALNTSPIGDDLYILSDIFIRS